MAKAKQTAAERLQAHALEFLMGKSDLIGVEVTIVGKIVNEDGSVSEVDMAALSSIPRSFSSGNRGFHLSGKVNDPTVSGQVAGVVYQVGCNITAIKSKEWVAPE